MEENYRFPVVVLGVLGWAWLVSGHLKAGPSEVQLADLQRVWAARERQVVTLDCEWTSPTIIPARCYAFNDEKGNIFRIPEKDYIGEEGKYRLRFSGTHKLRYEFIAPVPIQRTRTIELREEIEIHNGREHYNYAGKDMHASAPRYGPYGSINNDKPEQAWAHLSYAPLSLLYRSSLVCKSWYIDLQQLTHLQPSSYQGHPCWYGEQNREGFKIELFFTGPPHYLPLRVRELRQEVDKSGQGRWLPDYLVEAYYQRDDIGYRLTGWKGILYQANGQVWEQTNAIVKQLKLNPSLPDALFHFEYAPGTIIVDNRQTPQEVYLLRPDGRKRYIAQSEYWLPYTRLLETETGEAAWEDPNLKWLIRLLVVGLAVLAAGWGMRRWWQRRQARQMPASGEGSQR